MSKLSDQAYLLSQQYQNSDRLYARIELHRRFTTNPSGWFRWLFDQIEAPMRACVLELGAGPGLLWRVNQDRIPQDWEITLSNFSEGMQIEAQRNLENMWRPFRWAIIDAQSIPYPDDIVDIVIANQMLYHVPDRAKALSEIRRVLRSDGRLYAGTNGKYHMQEIRAMAERFGLAEGNWDNTGAEERFGLESGASQLSDYFAEVSVRRYQDALMVTEAEPLIGYVLSMIGIDSRPQRVKQFATWVREELAAHGTIRITKDSGLIVAQ